MNKKPIFSNFETSKRYDKIKRQPRGPFMEEYGEDIISEVVQNEIRVKEKKKKINKEDNNSSND